MRKSPDRADAAAICMWARGEHDRTEQVRVLIEQGNRERAEGRPPPSTEPFLSGQPLAEIVLGGDNPRPWRERLDDDLPTLR
jgi:hypothetical protein